MAKILSEKCTIEHETRRSYGGPSLDATRIWHVDCTDCAGIRALIEEEFKKEFSKKWEVYKYLTVELEEDGVTFIYFSVTENASHVAAQFAKRQGRMMRRISERLKAL